MVPAGGGRGTTDSLFFTGQCEACGFTIEHLPENSDGRRATAIRDWNREVKAGAGRERHQTRKVAASENSGAQASVARQRARPVDVPAECRSDTSEKLRTLALACARKFDAAEKKLLMDAAAEIEGSEDAYAVLVNKFEDLRKKLAHTERNLQATIAMVPCRPLA